MAALVLDGKALSTRLEGELALRVKKIAERTQGVTPVLATILVGDDPASATYVRMKGNACKRVGMESRKVELPQSTTTEQLLAEIDKLNADPRVQGILLQHPVPSQIDERACFDRISLENHRLAKRAKDIGSAAVFLSLVNVAVVWGLVLADARG